MSWRSSSSPRNKHITVRITEDESDDIDIVVAATGARGRSDVVRDAIEAYVKRHKTSQKVGKKTGQRKVSS